MKSMRWVLLVLCVLLPQGAHAALTVTEVAWMGSAVSANHEWIELYNDGPAMSVDGWTLSDGMNLQIDLAGTVPSNQYVVLERTSDDSVSGAAFLIYTGALVNTGATLVLRDQTGTIVDQVSGGADWEQIGGDNVTKETAQYTANGWVTAIATPGSHNTTVGVSRSEDDNGVVSDAHTATKKSAASDTVRLALPDVTLTVVVEGQTVAFVNQPVRFTAVPGGIGEDLIDSLTYQWNFGDGFVGSQIETEHVFQYPGTYVVTVEASYKRQRQIARHEITILPIKVSLTRATDGSLQIHNDTAYEIDLSNYLVKGVEEYTFPANTVLLPRQTITLPDQLLPQSSNELLAVYDTAREMIAMNGPESLAGSIDMVPVARIASAAAIEPIVSMSSVSASPKSFGFVSESSDTTADPMTPPTLSQTVYAAGEAEAGSAADARSSASHMWLVGFLLLLVCVVLLTTTRNET